VGPFDRRHETAAAGKRHAAQHRGHLFDRCASIHHESL
jgi:hypothetical protein